MFTTPCFIRKNTSELRKRLEELGYKPSYPIYQYPEVFKHIAVCNFFGSKYYGVSDDEVSHHGEIKDAIKNRGMIDCGTNEDLFLALAALRDDKPDYQWFVWDDENDKGEKFKQYIPGEPWQDWWWFEVHKATPEELIEYFNGKN
jgi:hypothetical protein